jgi:hypothetical protein
MSLNEFLKRLLDLLKQGPDCHKLVRSERFNNAFKKWLLTEEPEKLTHNFHKAYHYKKAGINCKYRVQLLQEPNKNSLILMHDPAIGIKSFLYLFELLKTRCLQLGYLVHTAHKRRIDHQSYLQRTDTYILTPPPTDSPGTSRCNQLYGNILLDYTAINRHPGYIRLTVTAFPNSWFSDPLPFYELMEHLFEPKEV